MANGNKQRLSLVNILKIKNFLELFIFDFKSLRNRIPLHLCFDHIVLFIRFILKYITFLVYNTKKSAPNACSISTLNSKGNPFLFIIIPTKIIFFFFNIKKKTRRD
jgi:hypothetical protein